jgi:hypothetical protein
MEGRQEVLGVLLHGGVLYFRKPKWDLSMISCSMGSDVCVRMRLERGARGLDN